MMEPALSVLLAEPDAPLQALLAAAGLAVSANVHGAAAGVPLAAGECDALLIRATTPEALAALAARPELMQIAFDCAVLVLSDEPDAAEAEALIVRGVEAVVGPQESSALPRAIRQAVLRKRVERSSRTAYATDLATGLPHQAQLLEHMVQLIALREREPAPMVLLVLRIEGYAAAAARLGSEAANVLRRKVAVRLRAGLRASDVVAAIGPDAFGVLLGHLESTADGERVAGKLVRALQLPLLVAGQPCPVAAAVGLALFPAHGKDARGLLQRASAQAGSMATVGQAGVAGLTERSPQAAANDESDG